MTLTDFSELVSDSTTAVGCGPAGWPATRLLSGPPARCGAEPPALHIRRLGRLPATPGPDAAIAMMAASGLRGRGGGEFPFAEKLRAAAFGPRAPLVVVNGSEGEPASRKDRTLLELRPHTVLDGASWAAAAVGAPEVIIYLEPMRRRAWETISAAMHERRSAGWPDPAFHLFAAPRRFVAGETSAVVAVLEGQGPLPRRNAVPAARCGAGGRPTVVSNTETFAHVAHIARFGPDWFRDSGSASSPGSTLVTMAGGVSCPGLVVEVVTPVTCGRLLERFGGVLEVPEAVLVGGYGGRWVEGAALADNLVDRAVLRSAGSPLGCGVLAPLPEKTCGLAVAYRLLAFLAGESSGQCGSCVLGLPMLVAGLGAILTGRSGRKGPARLLRMSMELEGRGGCGHPEGAISSLQSALNVFNVDADRHALGRPCHGATDSGWFPIPSAGDGPS